MGSINQNDSRLWRFISGASSHRVVSVGLESCLNRIIQNTHTTEYAWINVHKTTICFYCYRYYKKQTENESWSATQARRKDEKLDVIQRHTVQNKNRPCSQSWSTLHGGTEKTVLKRFLECVLTERHQKASKSGNVTARDEWRGCGVRQENPSRPLRWYSPLIIFRQKWHSN